MVMKIGYGYDNVYVIDFYFVLYCYFVIVDL